jgi:hypothetical protein
MNNGTVIRAAMNNELLAAHAEALAAEEAILADLTQLVSEHADGLDGVFGLHAARA